MPPARGCRITTVQDDDDSDSPTPNGNDQRKRDQELEDIKWLVGHEAGRRIAARLIAEAGVYKTTFHTSGSVMAFNEGKRSLGLFLLDELLTASPNSYLKILKENRRE